MRFDALAAGTSAFSRLRSECQNVLDGGEFGVVNIFRQEEHRTVTPSIWQANVAPVPETLRDCPGTGLDISLQSRNQPDRFAHSSTPAGRDAADFGSNPQG